MSTCGNDRKQKSLHPCFAGNMSQAATCSAPTPDRPFSDSLIGVLRNTRSWSGIPCCRYIPALAHRCMETLTLITQPCVQHRVLLSLCFYLLAILRRYLPAQVSPGVRRLSTFTSARDYRKANTRAVNNVSSNICECISTYNPRLVIVSHVTVSRRSA